jgi:hypothetical protein
MFILFVCVIHPPPFIYIYIYICFGGLTYVQVKKLKDLAFTSKQLLDLFIVLVIIFSFQNIEVHLNGEDERRGVQMKIVGF